jgi:hypothetical protein
VETLGVSSAGDGYRSAFTSKTLKNTAYIASSSSPVVELINILNHELGLSIEHPWRAMAEPQRVT